MIHSEKAKELDWSQKLTLICVFLAPVSIDFLGQVYLSEIGLLLILIVLSVVRKIKYPREVRKLALYFVLSVLVGMGSTLWVSEGLLDLDFVKFAAGSLLFVSSSILLTYLTDSNLFLYRLLGVYGLGFIVWTALLQPGYASLNIWKWGIGAGFFYFVVSVAIRGNRLFSLSFVLSIVGAIFSLLSNSRSLAALFFSLFVLLVFARNLRIKGKILFFVTAGGLSFFTWAYSFLASRGRLGEAALERYLVSVEGDLGLFSSRLEWLYTLPAFLENPLFGYGVNVSRNYSIFEAGAQISSSLGYRPSSFTWYTYGVPIHSAIMEFALISGLMGFVAWMWALNTLRKSVVKVASGSNYSVYAPLIAVFGLGAWNILFSPFGSIARLEMAIVLAAALFVTRIQKEKNGV